MTTSGHAGRRWSAITSAMVILMLTLTRAGAARAQTSPGTESVDLVSGCTNVSLTWPSGTPASTVAAAITPAGALMGIWRLDAQSQAFQAYSAAAPEASDLATVNPLDAVYVCMMAAGTLTRPVLGAGGVASVPLSPSIPIPVAVPLQVTGITDPVGRGTSATVIVQVSPFALCDIQYTAPAGSPPTTNGLGARPADGSGHIAWSWTIPAYSAKGVASVTITCAGQSVTRTFNVI